VVLAVAIIGGPLAFTLGGLLAPALHDSGQASIAANTAANGITNAAHLAAFVLASYLLPIGAIGLALLAYPRAPWLATIGGLLAVVGWLPYSSLTALDDLTATMAQLPSSGAYTELLDWFSTDAVMSAYLLVYIVSHLVAYVLLGLALRQARVIPAWAAWSIIASSPLTIAAFGAPGSPRAMGGIALGLLVLGSLPAVRTMATRRRLTRPCPSRQP
jgi:Na+/phosphate symporter